MLTLSLAQITVIRQMVLEAGENDFTVENTNLADTVAAKIDVHQLLVNSRGQTFNLIATDGNGRIKS